MSNLFDHKVVSHGTGKAAYVLPTKSARKRWSFIAHDPAWLGEPLPVPEVTKHIAHAGYEALQLSKDASSVCLRLVLHFGVRDPKLRQRLYELFSSRPKTDEAKLKLYRGGLIHLPVTPERDEMLKRLEQDPPKSYAVFWDKLQSLLPLEGLRVVDYGAASGGFVRLLRALGADAYGIDLANSIRAKTPHQDARAICDEQGKPLDVLSRTRFFQEDAQAALTGLDLFISNRLLRTINTSPSHRAVMDVITQRLLKPGGLVLVTPAIYSREQLGDIEHYAGRYEQFDSPDQDDGWDYTIARKLH